MKKEKNMTPQTENTKITNIIVPDYFNLHSTSKLNDKKEQFLFDMVFAALLISGGSLSFFVGDITTAIRTTSYLGSIYAASGAAKNFFYRTKYPHIKPLYSTFLLTTISTVLLILPYKI